MTEFFGFLLLASAFYGVVGMFLVRGGIVWTVALMAASAIFGAWLVALGVLFSDPDAAWVDCGTECNPKQNAVVGTLTAGFIALALLALASGIVVLAEKARSR
jgi:hypothetical protein